jgi:hypothetical protein
MYVRGVVRLLGLCAVITGALALPSVASANPPANDNYANRPTVLLGSNVAGSNVEASIESEEPLTVNDAAGHQVCTDDGTAGSIGTTIQNTVWWQFTGTGGPVTVSTNGSNFDTVLAVYDTTSGVRALQGCNDDIGLAGTDDNRVTSELQIPTISGHKYAVQVGGCLNAIAPCQTATGQISLGVYGPPANDDRANARQITASGSIQASNLGASTETGERTTCDGRSLGKSVWFRYSAPGPGTAAFATAGIDTTMAIYKADGTFISCNDDANQGSHAGSAIPSVAPAGTPINVTAGDYLVQVGGAYSTGLAPTSAAAGPFSVQVSYTAAAVQATPETPASATPTQAPTTPAQGVPAASAPAAALPSPTPVVPSTKPTAAPMRLSSQAVSANKLVRRGRRTVGTRFLEFGVTNAVAGSTVTMTCTKGPSPFRKHRTLIIKIGKVPKSGSVSLLKQLKKAHATVWRTGSQVTRTITKPGYIGSQDKVIVRKGNVRPVSKLKPLKKATPRS